MSREADFKQLLTMKEVAELLNVSQRRAWELARNGTLNVVTLGRQKRISLLALEALVREGGKPLDVPQESDRSQKDHP